MRTEYSVAPVVTLTGTETALDDVFDNALDHPDDVGFSIRREDGWTPVTYAEFASRVTALARGFVAAGISAGDRVALMSRNRFEWALCDYAIWAAGAVTVPIYETSSNEQVEWILRDSDAIAVIVEGRRHGDIVDAVRSTTPDLRDLWSIEGGDIDTLTERGHEITDAELAGRRAQLTGSSLATIVYTSGTTGRPKGCRITHRNLVAVYANTTAAAGIPQIFNSESSTLLFLPLAHVLARIIELSCVHARVHIGYTPDIKELAEDLNSFRPTLILAVPRVFEKLHTSAQRKAYAKPLTRRLFDLADDAAVRWSSAEGHPGRRLRLEHAIFDRLVYSRIQAALGARVVWSVSGGAPLGSRLGHFFRGVGVNVLEGYGMSESTTGGTLNLPGRQRMGSVGPPTPGCSVRIADDGEILLHGDFVFDGYWRNEDATRETVTEDGWLRTGDLGQIDNAGYVSITGRKKELIVTAGGKNVAPNVLEDRARAHWLVSQCVVVGDNRPYIACLLTLDPDTFLEWKKEHGKDPSLDVHALSHDPDLLRELQVAVDSANQAVSKAESIRRFAVLDTDLTEAGGELTPTLKLKRDFVARKFHDEIESLYKKEN
jgi:long-chain acyl-CoA synthetase